MGRKRRLKKPISQMSQQEKADAFYEELKELNRLRREGKISVQEWYSRSRQLDTKYGMIA